MTPKLPRPSRAEEMALFRHSVVGDLLARDLDRGELQDELKARAARRYRPPGAPASRQFHWKTLQTWYYDAQGGLDGLTPASRARGHALALDHAQRELLLEMRREHGSAATELILAEAVRNGAIPKGTVSEATLRRLYRDHDLGRDAQNRASRRERRRWQADRPCAIWHADVCHVWLRDRDGKPRKAYVHGILDDHSRYVVWRHLAVDIEVHQPVREPPLGSRGIAHDQGAFVRERPEVPRSAVAEALLDLVEQADGVDGPGQRPAHGLERLVLRAHPEPHEPGPLSHPALHFLGGHAHHRLGGTPYHD